MWRIIALLLLSFSAQAEYIDLNEGKIVSAFPCGEMVCAIVDKDQKRYWIFIDQKGERRIYDITDNEPVLLWDREAI